MGDLNGRVAVVTGAARGIGLACARRLGEEGATVVLADIDGSAAEESAAALPGQALAVAHDVRDAASAQALYAQAVEVHGRVDILVNNAGVGSRPMPAADVTDEEYDRVMNVNARGLFLTTRAFVPGMIEQRGGRIVNISSIIGQKGVAMVLPYVASKFAVVGMTHSLAAELAPHGITVNSVHPGIVETDLHSSVVEGFAALQGVTVEEGWASFREMIPLGRFQTPEDVADMTAFLASDRARNITGAAFNVDGGLLMR